MKTKRPEKYSGFKQKNMIVNQIFTVYAYMILDIPPNIFFEKIFGDIKNTSLYLPRFFKIILSRKAEGMAL